jgi:acetyl esterase/lipase
MNKNRETHSALFKRIFAKVFVLVVFVSLNLVSFGQEYILPLYEGAIPNSKNIGSQREILNHSDVTWASNVQVPDITVYLPSKRIATGQAVVICPGGSYGGVVLDLEGSDMARYLNSIGVAGIVLKYRLPGIENCTEPHKAPLMDAQRAMRIVRFNAGKWNIDPTKIGIMGFSAGGHLASTLGTHFDYGNMASKDSIEQKSCRPDFMVLVYPVISFTDACTHIGSRENLLGKNPDPFLVRYYSNELQVQDDTPPAFIVHADNDSGVPAENSILMYEALRKKKIPTELHILSEGEHGFGLGLVNNHVASWTSGLNLWLNCTVAR